MRMTLPTRVTKLVGVGSIMPASPPSAARPFLSHPHFSMIPILLATLGYETNYRVQCLREAGFRITLGGFWASQLWVSGNRSFVFQSWTTRGPKQLTLLSKIPSKC